MKEGNHMEDARHERWHVGKEVPLALIFGMLLQTGLAIWWARGQVAVDADLDQRLARLEKERDVARVAERMAVMEAAVVDLRRSSERMEVMVQQALAERRGTGRDRR